MDIGEVVREVEVLPLEEPEQVATPEAPAEPSGEPERA